MDLPLEYLNKIKNFFGDDFDNYIDSFNYPHHMGIRTNLLKISPTELSNLLDFELSQVPWCDTGFYYSSDIRPAKNFYYNAGLFYIQEPSAMCVVSMLPISEGDKVLDLCSAPGGKATHVASKLNNTGVVVCNDISTSRCKALIKNLELSGVTNAIVLNETPEKLSKHFPNYFDKIIIDAPCSGEGMFRKDKETLKNWTSESPSMYHDIQLNILNDAKSMLDFGGIIAYSTCTFSAEENELTISEFLENNPDFKLIDFDKTVGFEMGRKDTIHTSCEIEKTGRLLPHKVNGEGHFLALLQKIQKDEQSINSQLKKIINVDSQVMKPIENFFHENMKIPVFNNIFLHKSSIFSIPDGLDLSGLRVMRSGFHIGEIKSNRFEPSQALAMGLKINDFQNNVNLDIDDERLLRYFKGESFPVDNCSDGWVIVCVNTYPIGFGKVHRGRLKNKYAVGWKI